MKKILALFFLLVAAGWALFVYGYSRNADATGASDIAYVPDRPIHAYVQHLETLQSRMRRQLDLLDHTEKKQAAAPTGALSSKPLRDPFSSAS